MDFAFHEKPTIEICGKKYECDPTNNDLIVGAFSDFPRLLQASQRLLAALRMGGDVPKILDETLRLARDFIVGCLGQDVYDEVFAGRKPNTTEHIELCTHIYNYLCAGRGAYLSQYEEEQNAADEAAG